MVAKMDSVFSPVRQAGVPGNWFFDFGKHWFAVKTPTPQGPVQLSMPEPGSYLLSVPEGTCAVFKGKEYPAGKHELK